MIRNIGMSEYLKRYDNMEAGERQLLIDKVVAWLEKKAYTLLVRAEAPEAQLQNVMQVSVRWNDDECEGWNEGVKMLTAFANNMETWLPEKLYKKSAARCIRRLVACLMQAVEDAGVTPAIQSQDTGGIAKKTTRAGKTANGKGTAEAGKTTKGKGTTMKTGGAVSTTTVSQTTVTTLPSGDKPAIPRPKHIDQYVHLLPESTQQKAAEVQGLLRDMDAARENMRLLMGAPQASNDDREKWAKKVASIDKTLKVIYRELDSEWEKLVQSGRVVVDDLGNARVFERRETRDESGESSVERGETRDESGETSVESGESSVESGESKEANDEDKKKIKSLQSWLRDTRRGNDEDKREAYVKQWKEKYQELLTLGGQDAITNAIRNAASHYGIEIQGLR